MEVEVSENKHVELRIKHIHKDPQKELKHKTSSIKN